MVATDRPALWIVAGPNGSGKSSAYDEADVEGIGRSVWIINPDLLAARIRDMEGMEYVEANLAAVQRIERWLEASIDAHQTIGVETVLSTDKYRRLVALAKERGHEIRLIYVILDRPELNIARVRYRVTKGGHSVPEDKIVERYFRSLQQMPWFLNAADLAWLYDNSGSKPLLVGEKRDGAVTLYPGSPDNLTKAVLSLRQG